MNNIIAVVAILLVLGGVGLWYVQKDTAVVVPNTNVENANNNQTPGVNVTPSTPTSTGGSIPAPGVTVYTVTAANFSFSPGTITVNKGDKVRIILNNTEGNHDFVIDEFNARTKVIRGAGQDIIEFTADKIGTFEYYCSVGSHREMGMKGSLIVK